jgi:hypothetical protein
MRVTEVISREHINSFHQVPRILYQNDPFWVCPLDIETERIFNPEKNKLFRNGNARRWILFSDNNSLIGRIAAFYNTRLARVNMQPTGGIGWFECINDQEAANLLFNTAKTWLASEGMEAMDGPINFGSNDTNWGLLVEGFTHPGFGMPYHLPYYRSLFENYGFRVYFVQYSYHLDITRPFPERFWKIAEWVAQKPDFHFEHAHVKNKEKYVRDMVKIYNSAWVDFKADFTPLEEADVLEGFERSKGFIDEELIWFVYHKNEPIAFFLMYPDINQILKHLNGQINLVNKLRFFYYLHSKKITRTRATVAGVVPKFRNSGVESGIFKNLEKAFRKKYWYTEIELSWVGDFNPKMRSIYEAVGGELAKKHHTYRYLFDPKAKFERFMPDYMEKFKQVNSEKFQEEITYDPDKPRPAYNILKHKTH